MIRVVLPAHLRALAHLESEVKLEVEGSVTLRSALDALEVRYPTLRGTIRDHVTQQRRPFVRFFACEQDLSHQSPDTPLPDAVVTAKEPLLIIGAIAGGLSSPWIKSLKHLERRMIWADNWAWRWASEDRSRRPSGWRRASCRLAGGTRSTLG
jgi:molybdopterin converting factor small subunit